MGNYSHEYILSRYAYYPRGDGMNKILAEAQEEKKMIF